MASRSCGHGTDSTDPEPAATTIASAIVRSDRCSSFPTLNTSPGASDDRAVNSRHSTTSPTYRQSRSCAPSPKTVIGSSESARRMKIGRNPCKSSRRRCRGPYTLVSRTELARIP